MSTAIETKELTFSYPADEGDFSLPVFEKLNLNIEAGSFVAILGHNGCGKSTLAKQFNAVLLPEGGSVYVFGMDTADENLLLDILQAMRIAGMQLEPALGGISRTFNAR